METTTEQLYAVVIFERDTKIIDAVIGENMSRYDGTGSGRNTADLRVQTGNERINEHYGCKMVPAGKFKKGDALP